MKIEVQPVHLAVIVMEGSDNRIIQFTDAGGSVCLIGPLPPAAYQALGTELLKDKIVTAGSMPPGMIALPHSSKRN